MQIVFMGTPDFAVGALEALITGDSGSAEIRMSEHPCIPPSEIPRGISYPESDHRRRG